MDSTSNDKHSETLPTIFIFDGMRCRSHLFFRYLSTHPSVKPLYHVFLMAAFLGPEQWALKCHHSEVRRKEMIEDLKPFQEDDTYASCAQDFVRNVEEARREGKIPMANEHIFNVLQPELMLSMHRNQIKEPDTENPTCIPTPIFRSLKPIIFFRHPVTMINSIYRTCLTTTKLQSRGDEDFEILTSGAFRFFRYLFDFFRSQGREALIVDSEDLLWRTEIVSKKICEFIGVDEKGLSERWEKAREDERPRNAYHALFLETILESEGIERGEEPEDVDLEKAFEEWTGKYGVDVANDLKRRVELAMPDYEYLCQWKV